MKKVSIILAVFLAGVLLAACSEAENKGKYNPEEPNTPNKPTPPGVRYRGIGLDVGGNQAKEADIRRLAGWGVNHVRWPFEWWNMPAGLSIDNYYNWINTQCNQLEAMLPVLEEVGVTVCLDMHTPPRGRDNDVMVMFREKELQDAFLEAWRRVATRFKDNKIIVYYDLLNEPNEGSIGPGCKNWRNLAIDIANAINAIDDTKQFIFEVRADIYKDFQPLPVDNVVYSIHVYTPHLLTHQGVSSPNGVLYPGDIDGELWNWAGAPKYWDKATLRRFLDEVCDVFDFVKNNKVEIYVGEFSCARWAPDKGAYNYIRDCLEIFEEEGWHWAYFCDYHVASANYGATAWSAEYDEVYQSGTPVSEPTDRLLLLQEYWAKNGK